MPTHTTSFFSFILVSAASACGGLLEQFRDLGGAMYQPGCVLEHAQLPEITMTRTRGESERWLPHFFIPLFE